MTHLKAGDKAPGFTCNDQSGTQRKLSDFKGKKVVLYFYPKDDTSGCTAESCNLRDNYQSFISKGYEVLGISPDSEKSHLKFIKKYSLPFPLLVDTDHKIADEYGVWGQKQFWGRKYMGILRTTFIIDEKGIIERVIDEVDTKEHSTQILG